MSTLTAVKLTAGAYNQKFLELLDLAEDKNAPLQAQRDSYFARCRGEHEFFGDCLLVGTTLYVADHPSQRRGNRRAK